MLTMSSGGMLTGKLMHADSHASGVTSANVIEADPSMRCGETLASESNYTTRGLAIFARSKYAGLISSKHAWRYTIILRNNGVDTVQVLTRHWFFIDSERKTHEVKSIGAQGVTPVLAPGDEFEYESGVSISTPTGSMHGSYQFATLNSVSRERPGVFSARVARLALADGIPEALLDADLGENATFNVSQQQMRDFHVVLSDASQDVNLLCNLSCAKNPFSTPPKCTSQACTAAMSKRCCPAHRAPCREEQASNQLAPTSVHATRRIIVSANAKYIEHKSNPKENLFLWEYDVHLMNARYGAAMVVGHHWEVQTKEQATAGTSTTIAGPGVGGRMGAKEEYLPASEGFRVQVSGRHTPCKV